MSILINESYANPDTKLWASSSGGGGGGSLVSTITGPFSNGTGSSFQGYNYTQNITANQQVLDLVMTDYVFAPNTTYQVNITMDFGNINGGCNTGGYFEIYYGNPLNIGVMIGKSYFNMTCLSQRPTGCNISFTFANADPGAFKGIFFNMKQLSAPTPTGIYIEQNCTMTIYTSVYAIGTKENTVSDNGLSFYQT
jgi:hypothetical protein